MLHKSKIISVVLAVLLLPSFILVGCDSGSDSGKTSEPSTAQTTATATTSAATATPTPTPTPVPTEEPPKGEGAVFSLILHEHAFTVFGTSEIVNSDAGVPLRCIKLQHIPDPTDATLHDSGAYLTFNSSEECKATVLLTLSCPDGVNGATGYMVDYCVNEEFEDLYHDMEYVSLDEYAEAELNTLQQYEIEINIKKGENKLYLFQETIGYHGGWRIVLTQVEIIPSSGAIEAPQEPEREINVIDFPATGLVLNTDNYDYLRGIQTEPTTDEKTTTGKNFGYFEPTAAIDYVLNVAADGEYVISYRLSSPEGKGELLTLIDDTQVGSVTITEATNGFQNWIDYDQTTTISLTKGQHTLRFQVGEVGGFNISYFTVAPKA